MTSFAMYSDVMNGLALVVSRGLDGDADEDFMHFLFRYPSPNELLGWCCEGVDRIRREPLDAEADRAGVLALAFVGRWLTWIEAPEVRMSVTQDFWRAYAEVSSVHEAREALVSIDRDGDESAADRAVELFSERYM